jgi:hypothetical protein
MFDILDEIWDKQVLVEANFEFGIPGDTLGLDLHRNVILIFVSLWNDEALSPSFLKVFKFFVGY